MLNWSETFHSLQAGLRHRLDRPDIWAVAALLAPELPPLTGDPEEDERIIELYYRYLQAID